MPTNRTSKSYLAAVLSIISCKWYCEHFWRISHIFIGFYYKYQGTLIWCIIKMICGPFHSVFGYWKWVKNECGNPYKPIHIHTNIKDGKDLSGIIYYFYYLLFIIIYQEFVVGYSKAPKQPQSSARPICHSHAMMRTGHLTHCCIGACATHCATGDGWGRFRWSSTITRLTADFICDPVSDLVICKQQLVLGNTWQNVLIWLHKW